MAMEYSFLLRDQPTPTRTANRLVGVTFERDRDRTANCIKYTVSRIVNIIYIYACAYPTRMEYAIDYVSRESSQSRI